MRTPAIRLITQRTTIAVWLLFAGSVSETSFAGNAVVYVDKDAAPGGNGLTWATAFQHIQPALDLADPGGGGATTFGQVWVAEGTYLPTLQAFGSGPRSETFFFHNNLQILGGFAGSETDASQHDPMAHPTILSGDIGAGGVTSDNCRHVLRAVSFTNATAVLDGFTVTAGNADSSEERGGGLYSDGGSPTIRNCRFVNNSALREGGAIYSTGSSNVIVACEFEDNTNSLAGAAGVHIFGGGTVTGCHFENNSGRLGGLSGATSIIDCTFVNNTGTFDVGGASATSTVRSCTFVGNTNVFGSAGGLGVNGTNTLVSDCVFVDNSAAALGGGAIIGGTSTARVINCLFLGNSAGSDGGGLRVSGTSVTVANCLFSGNSAQRGAGMRFTPGSAVNVANCTFSRNSASIQGGGIYAAGTTSVSNCVLWGNSVNGDTSQPSQILSEAGTVSLNYSCVEGLTGSLGGTGNIATNPQFVDDYGPDAIVGTEDDSLALLPNSPCIDAANNAAVPADTPDLDGDLNVVEPLPIDASGLPRFFDDPLTSDTGSGTPPIVDMGAYEYDGSGFPPNGPGVFVGTSGGSWFVASNWAGNAVPDSSTNVVISTTVLLDQAGAEAASVSVRDGGNLLVGGGELTVASTLVLRSGGAASLVGASLVAAPMMSIESGSAMLINDAAAALVATSLTIQTGASWSWNAGQVAINGGTLASGPAFSIGCSGQAELVMNGAAKLVSPAVTVCQNGRLAGTGVVQSTLINNGTVAPGASPGKLTVNGAYSQSATGDLDIELAGYLPGTEFDQLVVTGTTALNGTMNVLLLPAFAPELAGDQRLIISPSFSGTFATTNLATLPGTYLFNITYGVVTSDQQNLSVRLLTTLSSTGSRLYVMATALPGGDGQSWITATPSLAAALDLSGLFPTVNEIWVAAGTYTADRGTNDRERSLQIAPSLDVYGGFEGIETQLSERDFVKNVTVLSGDLNGDDGSPGTFVNNGENSYRVVNVNCASCPNPPRLDGFTIIGGNANHPNVNSPFRFGAGMSAGDGTTVANCTIAYNHSSGRGAGMISGFDAVIDHCDFLGNVSDGGVGGLGLGGGMPQILDCVFESNVGADAGGASVSEAATATIERCLFTNNGGQYALHIQGNSFFTETVTDCDFLANVSTVAALRAENNPVNVSGCTFEDNAGLGVSNGSPLHLDDCEFIGNLKGGLKSTGPVGIVNMFVQDCSFVDNINLTLTGDGGGANVDSGGADFTNCTFTNNLASDEGGGLCVKHAIVTLDDCEFDGNTAAKGSGISNWTKGELRGNATLLGADEFYNAGRIRPGPYPGFGTIQVNGAYRHVNLIDPVDFTGDFLCTLYVDLGGTIPGVDFDVLDVSNGDLNLESGALQVDLADGFVPQRGQVFNVVSASDTEGAFDVASMPGLSSGLFLNVTYGPTGVSIAVEELETLLAFASPTTTMLSGVPSAIKLADMDNDGDLDAVMTIPAATNPTTSPGQLAVLRNAGVNGSGTWLGFSGPPVSTQVGNNPKALAIGNFNGDLWLDVVVGNNGSTFASVLFNNADGSGALTLNQNYSVDQQTLSVASGTTNGDLTEDFAVGCGNPRRIRYFRNNGTGGFTQGQSLTVVNQPRAIVLVDLDHDQHEDLAAALRDDNNFTTPAKVQTWIFDSGSSTFGPGVTVLVGRGTNDLLAADLNNDTYADLITSDTSGGTLSVLTNPGDGSPSLNGPSLLPIGIQPRSITASDLDLDGDKDLAVIVNNGQGAGILRIVRNDLNAQGQLIFATAVDLGAGVVPTVLFAGDINQDQSDDLLALNISDIPLLLGTAASLAVLLNEGGIEPCPADVTNDGVVNILDLLAVIAAWGSTGSHPADVTGDGVVNILDLLGVIASWGQCP